MCWLVLNVTAKYSEVTLLTVLFLPVEPSPVGCRWHDSFLLSFVGKGTCLRKGPQGEAHRAHESKGSGGRCLQPATSCLAAPYCWPSSTGPLSSLLEGLLLGCFQLVLSLEVVLQRLVCWFSVSFYVLSFLSEMTVGVGYISLHCFYQLAVLPMGSFQQTCTVLAQDPNKYIVSKPPNISS